jgi:hypothetical protein
MGPRSMRSCWERAERAVWRTGADLGTILKRDDGADRMREDHGPNARAARHPLPPRAGAGRCAGRVGPLRNGPP